MTSKLIVKQKLPDATLYVKEVGRLMKSNEYVIVSGLRKIASGRTKRLAWNNALLNLND